MTISDREAALARIAARKSQQSAPKPIFAEPLPFVAPQGRFEPADVSVFGPMPSAAVDFDTTGMTPEEIKDVQDQLKAAVVLNEEAIKDLTVKNTNSAEFLNQNNLLDTVIDTLEDESRTEKDFYKTSKIILP